MTRVVVNKTNTRYDARHDILHVYLSPSELSVDDEDFPGIVIRRSIRDNRVTGLVIMDYSKQSSKVLRKCLPDYSFQGVQIGHSKG